MDSSRHAQSIQEVLGELGSGPAGLSEAQAEQLLARHGPNRLAEGKRRPAWKLLLAQFKDFLILLLLAAAVVSGVLAGLGHGDLLEPVLIAVIVLFAAALGFLQEHRAEQALAALRDMAAPQATVVREGRERRVRAESLVPGDVIVLAAGDRVPADARLVEVANLRVDEAPLTGESQAADKSTPPLPQDTAVADRTNMVFMGTTVVYGRGRAVVCATGMATEFGRIATMLQEVEAPATPLQQNLARVGKILGGASLAICAGVAGAGIAVGAFPALLDAFIWGVSLAVAAVPEALPAVVTIALALGVKRMARRNALIRHLPAVETLGCTTFVCSDKTGTLTQNEMTVRNLVLGERTVEVTGVGYAPEGEFHQDGRPVRAADDPHLRLLLQIGALCTDAALQRIDGRWQVTGDPTEGALVVVAAKAGLTKQELERRQPRVAEIPFSSERKRMTTIHAAEEGRAAYAKGAPEVLLPLCTRWHRDGQEAPLSDRDREEVLATAQELAGQGLRVLAFAHNNLPPGTPDVQAEQDMCFVGLAGIIDPPRPEVRQAVAACREAGIVPAMITGDHKLTAVAVAEELGMLSEDAVVLTGRELDDTPEEEFAEMVEQVQVYARVSPSHKLRVVEALQRRRHVVAMTGDGVNDAPALKRADIGVAMGITGTDVSKEASAMVLTDDNFASLVAAVEEGRRIFDNIKKFLMFLLSCNVGEVLLMLSAFVVTALLGRHVLPLEALQILWVNLVTDGLPALALAVDPPAPDVMRRRPRSTRTGAFTPGVTAFIGGIGLWTALATVGVFLGALLSGRTVVEAQCLTFTSLVMIELFNALNCHAERHSLLKVGIGGNKWLLAACASSLVLTFPLLYIPFFQGPFSTFALGWADWGVVLAAGVSVVGAAEGGKLLARAWGRGWGS
ncbi:MAG: calcium-translocating P-type ATPase, SERCA-type [Candidatus Bipolaricaulaceae bacterium]